MKPLSAQDYLAHIALRPRTHARSAPRTGLNALLAHAGHPERQLRCIHIAGSKGKGTTALMLEAMLQAGGRRSGVFMSPHLERWNERIRINGQPVSDSALDEMLAELQPRVAQLHAAHMNGPDFFEILLVAALCLFQRSGLDEAIIEAGIGARFDATRVVQPLVTALVSIELEHTHLLGADLATIAHDKAGIARAHVPLVLGPLLSTALQVVRTTAAAVGAPVIATQARLMANQAQVQIDNKHLLPLPAPSRVQADCAAVAFACLQAIGIFAQPEQIAAQALATLQLPGRQEVLAHRPLLLADAAHTQASFAALAETLALHAPAPIPLQLVVSCSGGRNLAQLAAPLLARAQQVTLTRADATRSDDPAVLAATLAADCPRLAVQVIESPCAALAQACANAGREGVVCATGSVYMAGVARRYAHGDKMDSA